MNPDPRLVEAIRRQPRHLQPILLATALVESGGRLDAVGDGGNSHGAYQENRYGRGSGIPVSSSRDPFASTGRAAREFLTYWNRGARGADLAYRAQRPADRASYIRKINEALPLAQRLLGGAPASAPGAPASAPTSAGAAPANPLNVAPLSGKALKAIQDYARQSEMDVLEGRMPRDPGQVVEMIRRETSNRRLDTSFAGGSGGAPAGAPAATAGPGGIVPILPGQPAWGSYGYGDPEGQGGRHLAVDWFAKAGTPFVAPIAGRIVRLTPDPTPGRRASGQVFGGTLAIRDDSGRLFVFRHSAPDNLPIGTRVQPGQRLGVVKDWAGSPHIHLETYKPGSSDREYGSRFAINPRDIFGRSFA